VTRARAHFLLLNLGHLLDHLVTLVFATVAALVLAREWSMSYAELIAYATPGFVAFGLFSYPAGRLADRWSREGMMVVFFLGIGLGALAAAAARTPLEMGLALFVVGMFAAIYHPVGLTLVVDGAERTGMALALNGIWGNLGVGGAALVTGLFIDAGGWRSAFLWPGLISIVLGVVYAILMWPEIAHPATVAARRNGAAAAGPAPVFERRVVQRVTAVILLSITISPLVFQATTFALPKILDERLAGIAASASLIGWAAFVIAAVASLAQLVVGHYLDTLGPRRMFLAVTAVQALAFAVMPGLTDWAALLVALAFTVGIFGQLPINDFMIGRMAPADKRASIYGARFVVTFTSLALALPLIGFVHARWGFDTLFQLLTLVAVTVFAAALMLPARLPEPRVAA
jgi:MFS family permease